jgi:hypothetical protein
MIFFVQEKKGENLYTVLKSSKLPDCFCAREELNLALIQIFKLAWIFVPKEQSNLTLFKSSNFQIGLCQRRRVDSCSIQIFKLE